MRLNLMRDELLRRSIAWNLVIERWIFGRQPSPHFVLIGPRNVDHAFYQPALIGQRESQDIAVLRPGAIAIIDVLEDSTVAEFCTTLLDSFLVNRRAQAQARDFQHRLSWHLASFDHHRFQRK